MDIRKWLKSPLFVPLAVTVIYIFSLHVTRPIVSLYATELGIPTYILGLLVSTYAVFPILLSVQSGKWSDRIGSKKMIYIGTACFFVAHLVPSLWPNIVTLFFSQACVGLGHNFMMIALQKAAGSAEGSRDKNVASLSLAIAIGEFVGPFIGGFAYEFSGFRATFLFVSLLILINFALNSLMNAKMGMADGGKAKGDAKNKSTFALFKQARIRKAVLVSGLAIYSKDLFVAYFPLYGSQAGLSPSQIGIVISTAAVAAIIVRAIQYPLVVKFTRGVVLFSSLTLGGLSFVLITLSQQFILLAVLAFFLGLGLGLGQPLSLVYIMNAAPPGRQGELLGLRIMFNRFCQLTAPTFFGVIGNSFGISPVFWVSGAFLVAGSIYSRDRETNPEERSTSSEAQ